MANEYLKNKWRMWFGAIDAEHKHKLSHDDITAKENRFVILNHIEGDQRKQVMATIDKQVNENVFYGKPGPISEDEFVAMQDEDFKADKEQYIAKRRNYFTILFQTMNLSEEGVTEEVFVNAFRASGHDNIALDKQFYHLYNPVDGKVPLSALIDSWVQFTTCEDSSKPDIVKTGLETGV
ncbi:sarcoplasmic calcium-binding protein-like [Ruditapes philippinarum]|uniref:sarcoplasmic calcium-binding protein-like n=1 Tax=Ruditapes philippinarum TaxID=129788 RepID=UPI00295A6B73|nr:sarcoplasmic calcium-binding protein-like [Ruditapes philippinarum]